MCMFCEYCSDKSKVIKETDLIYAIYDSYPVNQGHILIIPKRHIENFFETSNEERNEINSMLIDLKLLLDQKYKPDGYNIGINNGKAAGQTIMHLHVHLIPRYDGDMSDPKGGVRGVIPSKQKY